jgi:hypothetical protein
MRGEHAPPHVAAQGRQERCLYAPQTGRSRTAAARSVIACRGVERVARATSGQEASLS